MDFEDILKKQEITVRDLQKFQAIYDSRFVDQKFNGSDEKIRHTTLHLAKLLGKLARYSEKKEHGEDSSFEQIAEEVVPDLLVYCLWLAREVNTKPEKAYFQRMVKNIERMYQDKSSKEEIARLKELIEKR